MTDQPPQSQPISMRERTVNFSGDIERMSAAKQRNVLDNKLEERTDYAILCDANHPNHEENRVVAINLCKDPQDGWKFFVDNFCWIQDPEADNPEDKELPFLLWDFQEKAGDEIVKAVIQGYDLPVEKSRAMGATWLVLVILLWGWHFQEWDVIIGSRKAEEVDRRGDMGTLFEKLRFMMDRLPRWMFNPLVKNKDDKSMALVHPDHRASIVGEGNNPDFGRSDRRKVAFLDEFTSWEYTDRAAYQGLSATAKCRIPVSTPNRRGTNCFFYSVVEDHHKNNKPILRLHWTIHPIFSKDLYFNELGEPRSPWYDKQVERATDPESVAQEIDINYEASMAGAVFPNFSYDVQVQDNIEYNPNWPLYVSWDFGLDQTAMVWIQVDPSTNLYYVIDEYKNKSIDIYHYIDILDSKGYKQAIHYGDPFSGENRSVTSGQSPSSILRRYGIIFRSERTRIATRIAATRNILENFRISSNCMFMIEMLTSWQMRRPKSGNQISQTPDHSEHSHIGEAFTYFCFNYSRRQNKSNHVRKRVYQQGPSGVM